MKGNTVPTKRCVQKPRLDVIRNDCKCENYRRVDAVGVSVRDDCVFQYMKNRLDKFVMCMKGCEPNENEKERK